MTTTRRILIVTWDGAGNLVSTLGIAEHLARRGHDVRILGHPTIAARVGTHGWRFREFQQAVPFDSTAPQDEETNVEVLGRTAFFSPAVARDVMEELDREPADVLLADCMLYTALIAGQAHRVPTVALFHAAPSIFRGGPMFDMLSEYLPIANDLRTQLGLAPVDSITDIHDDCSLSLVASPREFDVELPLPDSTRFIGPVLDGPPINKSVVEIRVDDGPRPLVVVSFSTSYQTQHERLQQVIDALRGSAFDVIVTTGAAVQPDQLRTGDNVCAVGFAAHDRLLPRTSAVVTHAGMGTVMAALSRGVPVVCVPMGRDQFFNAAMVERLGVGVVVPPDGGPDDIRRAVDDLLSSDEVRRAAKRFAATIATYRGSDAAVQLLEELSPAEG